MADYFESVAEVESMLEAPLGERVQSLKTYLKKTDGVYQVQNRDCVKPGKVNYAVFVPALGQNEQPTGLYIVFCTNDFEVYKRVSDLVLFSGLHKEGVFCTQLNVLSQSL